MRQAERVAKFMRGHREKAGPFFVAVILQQPYFFFIEMNVSTAISAGEESVRQDLALAIERISVTVITTMEVHQDVRPVAVNFLEGEPRIPCPETEGFAQFETDAAGVEATRLFGSQAPSQIPMLPLLSMDCITFVSHPCVPRIRFIRKSTSGKFH